MEAYITLVIAMILIPIIYYGVLELYKAEFEESVNQTRKILRSLPEWIVLGAAEVALIRIWYVLGKCTFLNVTFLLLFVMLAAMTILCMTDYWETVVPNRILLGLLLCFILIIGFYGVRDINGMLKLIPSIVLGFVFSLICFGAGYILGKGSMGAGDVKLALVMGLYLTGEYVVGAILYGCIVSAVFSIVQLVRKKISKKDAIPFVPFLYIGLLISYMIG